MGSNRLLEIKCVEPKGLSKTRGWQTRNPPQSRPAGEFLGFKHRLDRLDLDAVCVWS